MLPRLTRIYSQCPRPPCSLLIQLDGNLGPVCVCACTALHRCMTKGISDSLAPPSRRRREEIRQCRILYGLFFSFYFILFLLHYILEVVAAVALPGGYSGRSHTYWRYHINVSQKEWLLPCWLRLSQTDVATNRHVSHTQFNYKVG